MTDLNNTKFSIIIPTYNRLSALKECLDSLTSQLKGQIEWEIIVINDGGKNDHSGYMQIPQQYPQVKYFYLPHRGPAAARNYGIKIAAGEIILFLDDDSLPDENWVSAIRKAWNEFPDFDGIGGYVLFNKKGVFLSQFNSLLFNWYLKESASCENLIFLSTCNAGFRKKILEKIAGFDENFKSAAGEDRDLNIKIHQAKGKLKLDEKILIYHEENLSLKSFIKRNLDYGKAAYKIYSKYPACKHLSQKAYLNFCFMLSKKYRNPFEKLPFFSLLVFSQILTSIGYLIAVFSNHKTSINSPRLPLTTRLDANLGYECNNNCLFCYFKSRKQQRINPSTEETKKYLAFIKKLGIRTLEITGGEPTIRSDILELISFAKNDLKFEKISIITNASRFCDETFAKEAIKRGIDDVLISLHGHNQQLNDLLTGRNGSFQQTLQAIKNVQALGVSCRTNTVVTQLNYNYVIEIAELLSSLGVKKINFIFFSPLDDAFYMNQSLWPKYSDAAPFIKRMIDLYKDKFETISIKVIPFCFMQGYEKYVTDFFQNIYDPFEWDFYKRVRLRRGFLTCITASLGGLVLFMDIARIWRIGWHNSLYEAIMHTQAFRECVKNKTCQKCALGLVCPGVWKPYAKKFGTQELSKIPIKKRKIKEIDWCLRERFSDYYKD